MKYFKLFEQFIDEATDASKEREKMKDMRANLRDAEQTETEAEKELRKIQKDDESEPSEIKTAKLELQKAQGKADQLDAEVQLKSIKK
jgi:multidrug resistance efflux pump